jgi:hypothetical protein
LQGKHYAHCGCHRCCSSAAMHLAL